MRGNARLALCVGLFLPSAALAQSPVPTPRFPVTFETSSAPIVRSNGLFTAAAETIDLGADRLA